MKKPKILVTLSAAIAARRNSKLRATARTAPRASMDSYETDEPTTKLSSAFIVVLILHCVAVGGIYAFNSIKASRRTPDAAPLVAEKPKAAPETKAPAPAAANLTAVRAADAPVAPAPVPSTASPRPAAPAQYTVKAGDNATKIAFAYRMKPDELLAANNLKADAVLRTGQLLTIPPAKTAAKPPAAEPRKADVATKQADVPPTRTTPGVHIVKKGETAFEIAKTYGLTAEELLKLNKVTDAKKLQPGQTLTLPKKKG